MSENSESKSNLILFATEDSPALGTECRQGIGGGDRKSQEGALEATIDSPLGGKEALEDAFKYLESCRKREVRRGYKLLVLAASLIVAGLGLPVFLIWLGGQAGDSLGLIVFIGLLRLSWVRLDDFRLSNMMCAEWDSAISESRFRCLIPGGVGEAADKLGKRLEKLSELTRARVPDDNVFAGLLRHVVKQRNGRSFSGRKAKKDSGVARR